MDKLTWFKFSPSDWMMGKIQKCSPETRGMFMNLCCIYWNKECKLSIDDAEIEVDDHIQILIKKKIVEVDGNNVRISFLDEQMNEILETSEKRRFAANKRWSKDNASALQNDASALQNDADKIREDKIREDKEQNNTSSPKVEAIDFDKLLEFINKMTRRKFKIINANTRKKYKALLKMGYEKEDILKAIREAVKAENHIANNYQYLTPEFFSRPEKIELYSGVNELKKYNGR